MNSDNDIFESLDRNSLYDLVFFRKNYEFEDNEPLFKESDVLTRVRGMRDQPR